MMYLGEHKTTVTKLLHATCGSKFVSDYLSEQKFSSSVCNGTGG